MKTCACGSQRILYVTGKVSDMCALNILGHEYDGYVPEGLQIGDGDYLEFDLCMDCGNLQGKFPVSTQALRKVFPEY